MPPQSKGAPQADGLSQAEPVSRLGPSGFDPSRELLGRVLDYYEGRAPYDFHRLSDFERSCEAFDAWQEIAGEIARHLGRERKTKRQRRRELLAIATEAGTAETATEIAGSVHEGAGLEEASPNPNATHRGRDHDTPA